MSITCSAQVSCPCGAERRATLVRSLNAERHPALRASVLERRLHVFSYATCGGAFTVPAARLRLESASPETLVFVAHAGGSLAGGRSGGGPRSVEVQRALYDALNRPEDEILERHPGLASGPHVSLLRLVPWPGSHEPAVPER